MDRADRVVSTSLRSEPIGAVQKVLLIDGFQNLTHGVLDNLVLQRRDAQRPCLAWRLGDVDASDRLMTPALRPQPLVEVLQVGQQVLPVALLRDPIHAFRRSCSETTVGACQCRYIEKVGQRVEPSVGFLSRSFGYLPELW
jgi:hypothetical protein